ncbi:MAG: hypothetical protein RLZ04_2199, partial [Actinomycetota bacterium]
DLVLLRVLVVLLGAGVVLISAVASHGLRLLERSAALV